MDANQFSDLLKRYRLGTCTEEERKWVDSWYNQRRNNIYNPLTNEEELLAGERIYGNVMNVLTYETPKNVVPLWRQPRVWWVAAGTMLLMATAGYYAMNNKPVVSKTVKTTTPVVQPMALPGGNKAVLTLADGSSIVLDSAANGALTKQGASTVMKKQDGELVYKTDGKTGKQAIAWNTVSTPRGGQYQIVLPDGTRVWLNAVTALHFPASFSGDERRVGLSGEAYFEVAKNDKMPFRISVVPQPSTAGGLPQELPGGEERAMVEVLGTHFNVKAYNDEASIKTTLLEGSVKMSSAKGQYLMKPGQQTRVGKDGNMSLNKDADVDEAVAWKNGRFQFNEADVETVMRDIARWYDVTIEYAGKVPAEKFEGEIPRSSSITEVFKILELSNVHCKIEGKKITVLP